MLNLCTAQAYALRCRVFHRDLSPNNMLLKIDVANWTTPNPTSKPDLGLIDFECAKIWADADDRKGVVVVRGGDGGC